MSARPYCNPLEIVARFSGARRIATTQYGGDVCALWGVLTGLDTWAGMYEGAAYNDLFLCPDGKLRLFDVLRPPAEFLGQGVLALSYRARWEGRTRHFRHEFSRESRPVIDWKNNVLTVAGGSYRVTGNGIVG